MLDESQRGEQILQKRTSELLIEFSINIFQKKLSELYKEKSAKQKNVILTLVEVARDKTILQQAQHDKVYSFADFL